MVVKKDNTREMYDRAKIEAGILHSATSAQSLRDRFRR